MSIDSGKHNQKHFTPGPPPKSEDVQRMFALIGRVASAFGSLECALDECLTHLINETTQDIGRILLPTINSFRTKIRLFKKLACNHLHWIEPEQDMKQLCSALQSCADRRNDIVHSTYLGISKEQDKLYQRWPVGRPREKVVRGEKKAIDYGVYSLCETELEDAVDMIEETEFALLTFVMDRIYGTSNQ